MLSMTVDKPTSMGPTCEPELVDLVVVGSTELLLPGVGETSLAGEPLETWHQDNEIDDLGNYSFAKFKTFVYNSVSDLVNRSVGIMMEYDLLR